MTSDEITGDDTPGDEPVELTRVSPKEAYKSKMKALAKTARRAAYQKAKARTQAARAAAKNSPAALERRQKLKEQRREAYLKAKGVNDRRKAEKKAADLAERQRQAAEAKAQKAAELLGALTTGDRIKPKLRLVKPEDSEA